MACGVAAPAASAVSSTGAAPATEATTGTAMVATPADTAAPPASRRRDRGETGPSRRLVATFVWGHDHFARELPAHGRVDPPDTSGPPSRRRDGAPSIRA